MKKKHVFLVFFAVLSLWGCNRHNKHIQLEIDPIGKTVRLVESGYFVDSLWFWNSNPSENYIVNNVDKAMAKSEISILEPPDGYSYSGKVPNFEKGQQISLGLIASNPISGDKCRFSAQFKMPKDRFCIREQGRPLSPD